MIFLNRFTNGCRSGPVWVMSGISVNKIKGFGRIYQKPFIEMLSLFDQDAGAAIVCGGRQDSFLLPQRWHGIGYCGAAVVYCKAVQKPASIVEPALIEGEETIAFPAKLTDDIVFGLYRDLIADRLDGERFQLHLDGAGKRAASFIVFFINGKHLFRIIRFPVGIPDAIHAYPSFFPDVFA
jgi:hypothetical protein